MNKEIEIKFKKLISDAVIPVKAHNTDVGYDIESVECEYDVDTDTYIYHTGLACETEYNDNLVHVVYGFPKSRNSKKECYLTNSVGVIDSDGYRGEIQARYKNRTSLNTLIETESLFRLIAILNENKNEMCSYQLLDQIREEVRKEFIERAKNLEFAPYKVGESMAQLILTTVPNYKVVEVNELNMDTQRGEGGFGSTNEIKK